MQAAELRDLTGLNVQDLHRAGDALCIQRGGSGHRHNYTDDEVRAIILMTELREAMRAMSGTKHVGFRNVLPIVEQVEDDDTAVFSNGFFTITVERTEPPNELEGVA